MKNKKSLILIIAVLAVIVLGFGGYHVYRFPATFRSLSDETLSEAQVNELREEIFARPEQKILVAYFSYSGTTRNVANTISERTGADLFEITPQNGYSSVYPVWWHATPAPVNTFLESYDLSGKLIIPFCTSGSSSMEETMPTFLDSCKGLAVYGERRVRGTAQIDEWLAELGISESYAG